MKQEGFEQFVHSIFRARAQEMPCSEFFDRLPRFVELEASGQDAAATLPDVHHHLGQCPECCEVYDALLQAVRNDVPPRE